jgi:preprotein translocase subunit SecG
MGVKQTTDVLEKGTWIFAGVIAVLCLLSVLFISGGSTANDRSKDATGAPLPASNQPANQPGNVPMPTTPNNTPAGNTPR